MTSRQDRVVFPGVTLRGSHVLDAAVSMLKVVPTHEFGRPGASGVEIYRYGYAQSGVQELETVTLPDDSQWLLDLGAMQPPGMGGLGGDESCPDGSTQTQYELAFPPNGRSISELDYFPNR